MTGSSAPRAAAKPDAPRVTFRDARASDVPEIGRVYARAFAENPAYAQVFHGFSGAKKHAALVWLFERRARLLLYCKLPLVVGVVDDDEDGSGVLVESVVAVCGFTEKARKPGKWALVRCGVLLWPCKWGFKSLLTALAWDAKIGMVGEGEVVMVAVRPGLQGQGIGGRVVRHMLQHHAARFAKVSLNTQSERNVAFYSRMGFETVSKTTYPDAGYSNWVMVLNQQPKSQGREKAD